MFGSNCYLVGDGGEGIIIDPGVKSGDIVKAAADLKLAIKYIILTHTHIDHICSVDQLREASGGKVLAHEADAPALTDFWLNGSAIFGKAESYKAPDIFVKDGDLLTAGNVEFMIIHTPGHTPGGICIKTGDNIFTGDTLFKLSIGRTDLGNGDYNSIMNSIKNKLMSLGDETIVYPGHGASTTIGYERRHNPFI